MGNPMEMTVKEWAAALGVHPSLIHGRLKRGESMDAIADYYEARAARRADEGKKHEVKRMLETVGCRIFYLRRDKIGGLSLDTSLKEGESRPLTDNELKLLVGEI